MKGYTPRPYYSLADVKRLAAAGNVFFARRRDGRSNPGQVGMTTREAHAVIAALVPRDFDLTSYDGPMPADVYKVPMLGCPGVWLYIKLQITEEGDLLVVISFHT